MNVIINTVILIILAIVLLIFLTLVILIFYNSTCRNPFKKRTRECAQKKDSAMIRMFTEGVAWIEQFKDRVDDLHIVNDNLNLYGEYVNLGYDKCAIIIQGRADSLLHSYYFADVYAKNGYNIFVMDTRAHGLSDGIFQTGGVKESDDLIKWIELINEKYNISDFTVHGVCLGGAMAIYTYCKLKKQDKNFVKRIVTDGLYSTYFELYKGHFKAFSGKSFIPIIYATFYLIFILARFNPFKANPIDCMKEIDIPILFICSTMDQFCPKINSKKIFEACKSEYKEIWFFNKGRHAHIRASQKTDYDKLIANFLKMHI